eukprot:scaffold8602_cov196-Amphora_coffeaeformis.AAC.2
MYASVMHKSTSPIPCYESVLGARKDQMTKDIRLPTWDRGMYIQYPSTYLMASSVDQRTIALPSSRRGLTICSARG